MDRVNINTASVDQLCNVRGIALNRLKLLFTIEKCIGPVTKMALSMMLMEVVHGETWKQLDFSVLSKQIKRERADTSLPLLLLISLEAEAAELESPISEAELQLSKLLSQSEGRPVKKIQGFQQSLPELHKTPEKVLLLHKPHPISLDPLCRK